MAGEALRPVEPAVALRRIAYLLERGRAESFRVRAFRRAAAAVDEVDALGPGRLEALVEARRLQDLNGVGETTARIIAEALSGSVPKYLRELEATPEEGLAVAQAAHDLRKMLRGDCHSHSDWSDGGSPIREMADAALAVGHEYMALTDHSPRLTVAHGLDAARLKAQLEVVEEVRSEMGPGFRLLTGIEVDILEDGALDQSEELLGSLDVVVASVHSKLRMDGREMTRRMIRAIESPHADILGHCTGRLVVGRGRPQSQFDPHAVFSACAATGTAVEINSRPERRDPPPDLLKLAVEHGCLVSIDTDAHAPGQLEWLVLGCEQAVDAGVDPSQVVNARPVDELLAWTGSHGG